jgi:hypothetical protein
MIMFLSRVIVTAAFVLLFALAPVLGQVADTIPRTQVAKWEVGVDLLPLIDKHKLPEATLFFRRNYAIQNHKCQAWRFRLGLDSENRDVKTSFDNVILAQRHTYAPYLSIGHEWKRIMPRYRWFMAIDVIGTGTYADQYFLVDISGPVYDDWDIRDYQVGLNGIVGFQVYLTKYLSISAESALDIRYVRKKLDTIGTTGGVMGSYGGEYGEYLNTSISPLLSLGLNYSLQINKKNAKR